MIKSKSQLAILLSKLAVFDNSKLKLNREQYATDSEAAAAALWFAYMSGDIEGKTVADLGCGTGLLGIGALLLGAKKAFFIDNDAEALSICKQNISAAAPDLASQAEVINCSVAEFKQEVDTVVQNPPFGTKVKHADKEFLQQAIKVATVVYSMHKIETAGFVKKFASTNGFAVTNILPLQLQLKSTYAFHKSRMKRIDVGLFRLEKAQVMLQKARSPAAQKTF